MKHEFKTKISSSTLPASTIELKDEELDQVQGAWGGCGYGCGCGGYGYGYGGFGNFVNVDIDINRFRHHRFFHHGFFRHHRW